MTDERLFQQILESQTPIELPDLLNKLPGSPLTGFPHRCRWAYGAPLIDSDGGPFGVVVIMARWLRQATKKEHRALIALSRLLSMELSSGARPTAESQKSVQLHVRPAARSTDERVDAGNTVLLRSSEVARMFQVTERTVINWVAAGRLPAIRTFGGHLRFRKAEITGLLEAATSNRA